VKTMTVMRDGWSAYQLDSYESEMDAFEVCDKYVRWWGTYYGDKCNGDKCNGDKCNGDKYNGDNGQLK